MTVRITSEKPNNFPGVLIVDAQNSSSGVTVILGTGIEGELVRVSVNLSHELADVLATRLREVEKERSDAEAGRANFGASSSATRGTGNE
jgi:hypothetical protein